MRNRQGCLAGFLELFIWDKLFNWAERRFGFGRAVHAAASGAVLFCSSCS